MYEFRGGYAKEYLGDINFYLEQRKVDSFREMELERTDEKTASVRQSSKLPKDNLKKKTFHLPKKRNWKRKSAA